MSQKPCDGRPFGPQGRKRLDDDPIAVNCSAALSFYMFPPEY
ncbi:hypothetical protein [Caproiciproducens faecalis]|nr:hypothetical protein [Caproiciproducens faecalis]